MIEVALILPSLAITLLTPGPADAGPVGAPAFQEQSVPVGHTGVSFEPGKAVWGSAEGDWQVIGGPQAGISTIHIESTEEGWTIRTQGDCGSADCESSVVPLERFDTYGLDKFTRAMAQWTECDATTTVILWMENDQLVAQMFRVVHGEDGPTNSYGSRRFARRGGR